MERTASAVSSCSLIFKAKHTAGVRTKRPSRNFMHEEFERGSKSTSKLTWEMGKGGGISKIKLPRGRRPQSFQKLWRMLLDHPCKIKKVFEACVLQQNIATHPPKSDRVDELSELLFVRLENVGYCESVILQPHHSCGIDLVLRLR